MMRCPGDGAPHFKVIAEELVPLHSLEAEMSTLGSMILSGRAADKVDKAEQLVSEVGRRRLGSQFQPVSSLAKEFFIDVDTIIETGEPLVGLTSGFSDIDRMTTGFYGGDMIIIGARPSMGKTS